MLLRQCDLLRPICSLVPHPMGLASLLSNATLLPHLTTAYRHSLCVHYGFGCNQSPLAHSHTVSPTSLLVFLLLLMVAAARKLVGQTTTVLTVLDSVDCSAIHCSDGEHALLHARCSSTTVQAACNSYG
jgi:hypothetical protein